MLDLKSVGFPLSQITLVANQFQRRDAFTGVELRDRFESARLGIPAEQARFYHDRLEHGESMVIVQGTEEELNRVASILNRRNIQDWRIYDPMVVQQESSAAVPRGVVATPGTAPSNPATSERHTAPDRDRIHRHQDEDAQTGPSHPTVTIIDRRDETRL